MQNTPERVGPHKPVHQNSMHKVHLYDSNRLIQFPDTLRAGCLGTFQLGFHQTSQLGSDKSPMGSPDASPLGSPVRERGEKYQRH